MPEISPLAPRRAANDGAETGTRTNAGAAIAQRLNTRSSTPDATGSRSARATIAGLALLGVLVVVALALPLFIDSFWLQLEFSVCVTAIGAIGLKLLTGTAGQLSLAHAFFLAVGAVSYCLISSPASGTGSSHVYGLGLPPIFGMVGGVAIASVAGILFAPISSRLRGLYLGVASIGLVFLGQYLLNTVRPVTGGFNGRVTPDFSLFGFTFDDSSGLTILGVPFGRAEKLWYLGLALVIVAALAARRIEKSRSGRAFRLVRDSEIAAGVMGISVRFYKARAFALSSGYAGLAGVLYAISIGSVAPDSFSIDLSIQFLAMVVIGGMDSIVGAIVGAAFVTMLPVVLQQYATSIPGLANAGTSTPGYLAQYIYGAAVIAVLVFQPAGIAGIVLATRRRLRNLRTRPQNSAAPMPQTMHDKEQHP